jgi:transcription-repair coupling factor (superfamily II helicase)
VGDIESSILQFWKDTEQRYSFLKHDPERPVMNPSDLFLGLDQFFIHAKSHPRIVLQVGLEDGAKKDLDESLIFSSLPDVSVHRRDADPLKLIRQLLSQNIWRVIICAESAGRSESIRQLMEESNLGESSDSASLFPLHPSSADSVAEFLKGSERFSLCISPLFNGLLGMPMAFSSLQNPSSLPKPHGSVGVKKPVTPTPICSLKICRNLRSAIR